MSLKIRTLFNKIETPYLELISSSIWSIIGSVIAKCLLFIIWIFIARILSPQLYGEFSIIKSTTLLFAEFVGMSFSIAATKYVAEYSSDISKLNKLIGFFLITGAIIGVVAFLVVFLLADTICLHLLKAEHLSGLLKASSLVLFVSTLNNGQLGILRGFNKYKVVAKINLLQIIFSLPFFILGTIYWGLNGAVLAYIVYNVIVCFIAQYEIRKICTLRQIVPQYRHLREEVTVIFNYILPYLFSIFVTVCAQWYNETRVASLTHDGFVQLGYYSAIHVIQTTIISFSIVVCSPFVPIMAKYKKDSSSINVLNRLNMLIPLYITMLIALLLMLFPQIVNIFYGSNYSTKDMYTLTVVVVSYSVLIIYRQAIARLVAVYECQWLYMAESFFLAFSFVAGFKLLYSYGVLGLTYTFLGSYLLSTVVFTPLYIAKGIIQKEILKNRLLWILIISLIISFGLYFIGCNVYIKLFFLVLVISVVLYYFIQDLSWHALFKK